jgi:hypothetical protein
VAGYAEALKWAEKFAAEGLPATSDPRGVTPPCVFISHRGASYTTACGAECDYEVVLLAPGPWNADAWKLLDEWEAVVASIIGADRYRVVSYRLALDSPPLPAYLYAVSQPVEV